MPEFENLLYETLDDGRICKVTLNRPEKLNALSNPLLMELGEALHDAEGDPEVRVVILAGAGRAFCAGYDLTTAAASLQGTHATPAATRRAARWSAGCAPAWSR